MAADSTKLEAVNEMLLMAGSMRASSLGSTRPDVLAAVQVLDQTSKSIQKKGWSWNTQYNQVFSPSAANEIDLPQDIFEARESSGADGPTSRWRDHQADFHKRGSRLYDALADTFTFTADVTLNVVREVAFEDIPQYALDYITARASREYIEITRSARSPMAEDKEARTRAEMLSAEYRNADLNIFNGPDTRWPDRFR